MDFNKKELSERDIITKYIIPSITSAGWVLESQIREEVNITSGRIFVKGKTTVRGERKRADIVLYYKPNIASAVVEGKDNNHNVSDGIQQALDYAKTLDVPVAISSNGDGFTIQYRNNCGPIGLDGLPITVESRSIDHFPSREEIWACYKRYKGIETPEAERIASQDYYFYHDNPNYRPRYYQQIAINRTVEAIAKGQKRVLLVMATGSGKTCTAFQIIWRLWKSEWSNYPEEKRANKRILFLADRDNLITQTKRGDFKYFKDKMTIIRHKKIDKSLEIYLSLYQGLTDYKEDANAYQEFSSDFFDLVVVDECHRGSAAEDSEWRKILDYFSSATHIGLTATPKETKEISSSEYFGDPIFTYSLKQGIDDGFLAPYKVIRVGLDVDLEGWRPEKGQTDTKGEPVEDRLYNTKDYERNLVLKNRTKVIAQKIVEYLKKNDPMCKTIVFCVDQEHASRMRDELWKIAPPDWANKSDKYIMRITSDDKEGKFELDNFSNEEKPFPVIAVTSKLLSTGTDVKTCGLIVLETNIGSMTEFKQIIGRGTRVCEDYGKTFFTIMDFRNVTDKFSDPDFDGEAVRIKEVKPDQDMPQENGEDEDDNDFIDPVSGEEVEFPKQPNYTPPSPPTGLIHERREKVYVAGVDVSVLNERTQFLDASGKLITTSLREYTRNGLLKRFKDLDSFLQEWNNAEKKKVILDELDKQGIILENLKENVKRNLDIFDLICHVAWDAPALTRRERAENVRKRNCFMKYGDKARAVLEALLDKYAEEGITNIEETAVLKVDPLSKFGTPTEIVSLFGSKANYQQAVRELEFEIYKGIA
ncbi:MAG: DEAD/DEAH box helicase family protein [Bacteroidales bacterium]|nr:DEAD/DEAH box helicase family protein [Bacteroidales bacterium]